MILLIKEFEITLVIEQYFNYISNRHKILPSEI